MTFRLDHHNKILTILESLDPEVLKKGSAYFGGGTFFALDFREYHLVIKAYEERSPLVCTGDLIKKDNAFILRNHRDFTLDES